MATGQTVIDRATNLIKVRTEGVTYVTDNANKNADNFIALQKLIAEWGEDDVLSIPVPALVSTTLDIAEGTERALAYNLAVEVAPDYGRDPSLIVFEIAKQTRNRLEGEITIDMSVDMSDLSFTHKYDIQTDR